MQGAGHGSQGLGPQGSPKVFVLLFRGIRFDSDIGELPKKAKVKQSLVTHGDVGQTAGHHRRRINKALIRRC